MPKILAVALLAAAASALPRLQTKPKPLSPRAATAARLRGGGALGTVISSVSKEIANRNASPAKLYGFYGACCNWFLGLSALYDSTKAGPEKISLQMTLTLIAYSALFGVWAGAAVSPPNYILCGSHIFNVLMQLVQLKRCLAYKLDTDPKASAEIAALGKNSGIALGAAALFVYTAPALQEKMPEGSYLASAGGPFTIHPWPPVTKVFLSAASLTDLWRPTDKISLPQYLALTITAAIFSKYALLVSPINYPLMAVNVLLFGSSAWHLGRKVKADFL